MVSTAGLRWGPNRTTSCSTSLRSGSNKSFLRSGFPVAPLRWVGRVLFEKVAAVSPKPLDASDMESKWPASKMDGLTNTSGLAQQDTGFDFRNGLRMNMNPDIPSGWRILRVPMLFQFQYLGSFALPFLAFAWSQVSKLQVEGECSMCHVSVGKEDTSECVKSKGPILDVTDWKLLDAEPLSAAGPAMTCHDFWLWRYVSSACVEASDPHMVDSKLLDAEPTALIYIYIYILIYGISVSFRICLALLCVVCVFPSRCGAGFLKEKLHFNLVVSSRAGAYACGTLRIFNFSYLSLWLFISVPPPWTDAKKLPRFWWKNISQHDPKLVPFRDLGYFSKQTIFVFA